MSPSRIGGRATLVAVGGFSLRVRVRIVSSSSVSIVCVSEYRKGLVQFLGTKRRRTQQLNRLMKIIFIINLFPKTTIGRENEGFQSSESEGYHENPT